MIIDYVVSLIFFYTATIILLMPILTVIIIVIYFNRKNYKKINSKNINNNVKNVEKGNIQNIVLSEEKRKGIIGEKIVAGELEKIERIQKNNKWYYD